MTFGRLSITCLCLSLCCAGFASAQTPETKPAAPVKTTSSKNAAANEAEQREKARRNQARSLLVALATDARNFNNTTLKARSLARIADTLWQVDVDQARLMFRKAWDAAETADQENDLKMQEDIRQQKAKTGGGYVSNSPPSIRREVLRLCARHDRVLSEEFLEKLKAQKQEGANATNQRFGGISEALSQRLGIARELLLSGETERALEFADPALTTVGMETVDFLSDVREKVPAAADARYVTMLASAGNNPQSDENTVSLLSSYIFTPHLYIIFSGNGTSTSQRSDKITPIEAPPDLRMAFFQAAAGILLKPLPTPGPETTASGLDAKYLVIKRMMPFFELSAPADLVESLRGQLNALNAVVTDSTRKRDDEWVNKGLRPDVPIAVQEQALLDRVDRARNASERDSLHLQLAFLLMRRGDMKARDYVSKIDDSDLRKGAEAYVDMSLASKSVDDKKTDQALELVSKGELTHVQKAWVLTQCAKLLYKTDREKALELTDAAAVEARRLETSDPYLPQALLGVANTLMVIEPGRAWDATFDAVKAANSAEQFSGEDGQLVYRFEGKGSRSITSNNVAEFNVEGIFAKLADRDYERAVELARGFQGEGPRAVATIAIAKAVLDKKKVAVKN
jgi:hypothetical protein